AEEHRYAVEARAEPHDLAGRAQLVEHLRPVPGDTPRQQLRLPQRDWERQRLQRHEGLTQRRAAIDSVPAGHEAAERALLRRLDCAAQGGEGRATDPAQHIRLTPLALDAARAELAADEPVVALQRRQQRLDVAAEVVVRLARRERAAAARPAEDQRLE